MSELQLPEAKDKNSFVVPEEYADVFIWAREEQETLLGRTLTPEEEKELWDTGTVIEGGINAA